MSGSASCIFWLVVVGQWRRVYLYCVILLHDTVHLASPAARRGFPIPYIVLSLSRSLLLHESLAQPHLQCFINLPSCISMPVLLLIGAKTHSHLVQCLQQPGNIQAPKEHIVSALRQACCFTPAPAGGHPSSSTRNRAGTWSAYSLVIWLAIWRTAERLHV